MAGHPVPVKKEPALEGEILPKAKNVDPVPVTEEWVARQKSFITECGRTYREVTEDIGGDPLAATDHLMRVIRDPWSNPLHIPKRYREEPATPPALPKTQVLTLQTRRA